MIILAALQSFFPMPSRKFYILCLKQAVVPFDLNIANIRNSLTVFYPPWKSVTDINPKGKKE